MKEKLYITIMMTLKERIISGNYSLNSCLPTENELEAEFHTSKITIRNAVQILEDEGYVKKIRGYGTTVVSNGMYNKLTRRTSFVNLLSKEGCVMRKEDSTLSMVELLPHDKLFQIFGNKCYKLTRIYYLDGKPYIYYTHFISPKIKMEPVENKETYSIYKQYYNSSVHIKRFRDEFFVDYASIEICNALGVDVSTPLLGRKRITYDNNDKIIEVSISEHNSKIHSYVLEFDV